MLARVFSCAVIGLEGVIFEVDYSTGLPAIIIVDLPDAVVQESREHVQTAIKNAGLHFPRHCIVVNLSPASIRKEGPASDLPIALGVILLSGHLPHEVVENTLVVGELSLDGVVVTRAASCPWPPLRVPMDTSRCSSLKLMRPKRI